MLTSDCSHTFIISLSVFSFAFNFAFFTKSVEDLVYSLFAKRRQRNFRDQLTRSPTADPWLCAETKQTFSNDRSYTSCQCILLVLTVGYRCQTVAGSRPRTRINKFLISLLLLLLIVFPIVVCFRQLISRV